MNETIKYVTIMIPTFNQSKYIEQCINSVLEQDYLNIEIIISDDSTNNETTQIVQDKFLVYHNVKYFRNNPPLGRVNNYHTTLYEHASGDYVLNLDGDDWLIDSHYISKAVKILNSDKMIVCVIGNQITFEEKAGKFIDTRLNKFLKPINDGNILFLDYPNKEISINHMTTVYRRIDAMAINFYRMDTRSSDRESLLRLILGKKVGYIDGIAGAWRLHEKNFSLPLDKTERYDDLKFIDSVYHFALNKNIFDKKILYDWYKKMKFLDLYIIFYDSVRYLKFKQFFKFHIIGFKNDKKLFLLLFPRLVKTIFVDHVFRIK